MRFVGVLPRLVGQGYRKSGDARTTANVAEQIRNENELQNNFTGPWRAPFTPADAHNRSRAG